MSPTPPLPPATLLSRRDTPPEIWLQPAVHPVYARLMCADLRRRGFGEADILAGTRLDWQALHLDNRCLSFEQIRRLVLHAMAISGRPWLGIEVGRQAQVALHGALGQAVAASSSVGQALALVQRYMSLRQRMVAMHMAVTDDGPNAQLHMVAHEYLMDADVRECMLGYLSATLLRLLETVTGLTLHDDLRIEWPFAEPPWAAQYQQLAAHNSFGHSHMRAFLSPEILALPCLAADTDALRVAERECERQLNLQRKGGNLTQRIQQRLAACQRGYPALEEMAALENVSPRTLIRHLQDEGSSYQQLLDDVRAELACWLLLQTTMSVEAIAERLGYGDTSNFSRTFRRWLGVTPREFRNVGGL
jgi:AraC-like DNA-binding protein